MTSKRSDFEEIGHSGGTVTVAVDESEGRLRYSMGFSNSNPVPFKLVTLYALPQGIAVEYVPTAGLGVPFPPPSVPGSYLVMLASDSEGMFGRTCPSCRRYWRAGDAARVKAGFCAYCGQVPENLCLTDRQRRYVQAVCSLVSHALDHGVGEYVWDLNELTTEAKDEGSKSFYLSDERQQTHSLCLSCGCGQDVLGRASYCCACGTRNDRMLLEDDLGRAKARARDGSPEGALRDAVSALDGFIGTVVNELVNRVPMTASRKAYWSGKRPRHKFAETVRLLDRDFGFKLEASIGPAELTHAHKMVNRRHLHEHRGGIVDQLYLDETGDDVRLGQRLTEGQEDVFSFIGSIGKVSTALMTGFHEMFAVDQDAIERGKQYGRVARAQKARSESAAL